MFYFFWLFSVKWLFETMEALLLAKGAKEFYRSSRVGAKAYIAPNNVRIVMDIS